MSVNWLTERFSDAHWSTMSLPQAPSSSDQPWQSWQPPAWQQQLPSFGKPIAMPGGGGPQWLHPPQAQPQASSGHQEVLMLVGQCVGVVALSVVADMNRNVGRAIVAALVILWVLWIMQNGTTFANWTAKVELPTK